MIRLFKHYVPYAVLFLALVEFGLLVACAEAGWVLRIWQLGSKVLPIHTRIAQLFSFAVAVQLAMMAVGAYGPQALQSMRFAAARLLVAMTLGLAFLALLFFLMPGLTLWRSNSVYAVGVAFVVLMLFRAIFAGMIGGHAFKRRIMVLGAGRRAERIRDLAKVPGSSFLVVGYIGMTQDPPRISSAIHRDAIESLAEHVVNLNASEVVLALDERRNALPLADLLRIKTTGVHVNELSSFFERETGRVDLDSVNPSWLIFSDGFSSGQRLFKVAKRIFDLVVSLILLVVTAPIVLLFAAIVKMESKGPAFYRQHRVGLYGVEFSIVKLRSMRQDAEVAGMAVWAEKDDPRITRVGRILRKLRIDELPQVWTVLMGDMSFVGPRPERQQFVTDLESKLPFYAERHMMKPGITGWAQINYPYGASLEDARHKLEYDLYYAKNYTPFLDLLILLQTVRVLLWNDGAR
ncbi:TIGR03013 family XrtA/PEP-CTERM system glycosyltransferase [Sphingomonas arantia]|uniref:TIGR03013 family XrtA/PEP-CTERM system glycosyltransferase n=1 Tax=Sphingomonas arantia TaxID=1460676 RepID=A0ABW4TWV9_9SPHN